MASIKINTGAVRNATARLSASRRCIDGLNAVISSVENVASPIFSIAHGLSSEFSQANRVVADIQRDVVRLTSAVNAIASSYELAEAQNTNRMRGTAKRIGFTRKWFRPIVFIPRIVPLGPCSLILFGGYAVLAKYRGGERPKWSGSSSFLNGEASIKPDAKWDLSKGEFYGGVKGKAEGWLWKGKGSVDYGNFHGDGTIKVGDVSAEGEAKFSLMKDGKLDPGIELSAGAGATALAGEVSGRYGNEDINVYGKAEGKLGTASASATARFDSGGVSLGAKAEAYAAKGSVSGGLNLGLFKVDLSLEGKAGGAGVEFGAEATDTSVSGNIGAGLGLGAGVKVKVDWSNAGKFIGDIATGATETGKAINSFLSNVGKGVSSLWGGR